MSIFVIHSTMGYTN